MEDTRYTTIPLLLKDLRNESGMQLLREAAESEKFFYVGKLSIMERHFCVRSLCHGEHDFISAWPTKQIAEIVSDFMNARSKGNNPEFNPRSNPIGLAFQLMKALDMGRLILPKI